MSLALPVPIETARPLAPAPLVEALPIAVYTTDAQGFLTSFNPAAATLWGREPQLGVERWSGALALLDTDGAPVAAEACPMAEVLRTGRAVVPTELAALRPDGRQVPFIAHPTPLFDREGTLTGAVNVLVDITTRKAAEEELRLGRQHLQLALEVGGLGMWDWYPDSDVVIWSDAHYTLLGYAVGEVQPSYKAWLDRVHPEDRAMAEARVRESLASSALYNPEYRVCWPDGTVRWVESCGRFDLARDGHPLRMIGMIRDITARKQAEAELARSQLDRVRVSRLSAMGAMASTLAHELNQPLTSAVNYLAAARHLVGPDDDQLMLAEAVDQAGAAVMRAGEIIRRIRRYTVDGEVAASPTRLDCLIEAAWSGLDRRQDRAGVELVCRLDPDAPRLMADPIQIEQVLSNLLRNAIEACAAMPAPRIEVTSRRQGDMVEVAVADNGRGLTDKVLAGLFREFATTKQNGIGLGLAICRTIVESHRGQLQAAQRPGGGALFTMRLPAAP